MNLKHLEELMEARGQALDSFSERIVTLSTALLALSVTFRKDIAGPTPHHIWAFKWALVCFVIASATGTFWKYVRVSVNSKMIKQLLDGKQLAMAEAPFILVLSFWASIWAFLIGIGLLTHFAWVNT